jgi:valyl-tRNA synthetase
MMNTPRAAKAPKTQYSAKDTKYLQELDALVKKTTNDLEKFRFHHAAERLYHYTWHTFADKIIEDAKPRLKSSDEKEKVAAFSALSAIHSTLLRLLHPFMPFITEALWQDLQRVKNQESRVKNLLMVESWPH